MKVILKEDIEGVGKMGDLVSVADGYARNFLLPHDKALRATERNIKQLNHQKRLVESSIRRHREAAAQLAQKIESTSCTIPRAAGENEKLFGSVTKIDIAEALREMGIHIDRRQIELEHPIKTLGPHTVVITLQSDIKANLKVWVIKA
ncbi:MAG: 50S ribosomal protein L9 [Deltaproteobacteria bacterium]|nr:MAG: 50S ribosomal protein L9 [Deltaproteobacteria bacterium]